MTTLADLKAAAKAERLRVLPGIGAKLEERIVQGALGQEEGSGGGQAAARCRAAGGSGSCRGAS